MIVGLSRAILLVAVISFAGEIVAEEAASDPHKHFYTRVMPLLRTRCWSCHGTESQEGGLRLDTRGRFSRAENAAGRWSPASRSKVC